MKITATLIKNHITKILYFFLIFHIKKWRLGGNMHIFLRNMYIYAYNNHINMEKPNRILSE